MADELDKLFPLPTTSFERYMLADDRASHPMAAFMELEVRGELDVARLLEAFPLAVARHPLLRARIGRNAWGLPVWELAPPREPDLADWDVPLTCPEGERFDMKSGPGMRVWVRHASARARITIQVHHACSDALGKLTFFADWLTIYARLDGIDRSAPLPQPNWEAFRRRSATAPVPAEVRRSVRPPGVLYDLYNFFYRPTVRLPGTPFDPDRETAPLPGLYGVSIGDDDFQRIRDAARRLDVSVNDWLLAALFVTMAEWTETHGPEPAHKVFRVTMPYSMRTDDSVYSPASNQIGYEILTHPGHAAQNFAELSRQIARYTGPVRALRTSTFTKLLRVSKVYSRFFPQLCQYWAKSFATVIFSNLGDVSRLFDPLVREQDGRWTFGDLVVDRIWCAPPTRPQTHLSMVVMKYGGEVHFMTRCEGRVLASSAIRGFLDHYRDTVRALASIEDGDGAAVAKRQVTATVDSA